MHNTAKTVSRELYLDTIVLKAVVERVVDKSMIVLVHVIGLPSRKQVAYLGLVVKLKSGKEE